MAIERRRSQSLQPRMQVDIFLLHRGLESRTTCSQTFLQNVSVDSYSELMHNFNPTTAEVQWTANSLLAFYITCQVLISCHATGHSKEVLQCTVRAGKYFAGNFSTGKECELNISSEKYIRIIDLSAEYPRYKNLLNSQVT